MNLILHRQTFLALADDPKFKDAVMDTGQVGVFRAPAGRVGRSKWDDESADADADDVKGAGALERDGWLLAVFDMEPRHYHRRSIEGRWSVDITSWPLARLQALYDVLEPWTSVRGVPAIRHDLAAWIGVCTEGGVSSAGKTYVSRTAQQACAFIIEYIRRSPGRRVYEAVDGLNGRIHYAYTVRDVEYVPERRSSDGRTPPSVQINVLYYQYGRHHKTTFTLDESALVGVSAAEALARSGIYVETPALRAAYLEDVQRYQQLASAVGTQLIATGRAAPHNPERARRWSSSQSSVNFGVPTPTRVVVDVYAEDGEEPRGDTNRPYVPAWFWENPSHAIELATGEAGPFALSIEDIRELQAALYEDVSRDSRPDPEIPLHPDVVVFSLRHHSRFSCHIAQLAPYVYDEKLATKLVLPPHHWQLIEMLTAQQATFVDVVAGKGDGAIVLCEGAPGTGKTMTAEAFAEHTKRPLYNVQAAQLGLDAQSLEKGLTTTFERARRWNAIVLIDEADVYVARRGSDLVQNSLVGVFLRLLEYQPNVLFLTTNRADLVDDAILSRCLARITYSAPTDHASHLRMWRALAAANGLVIPEGTIAKCARETIGLSGRDVKNLLKLAALYHRATKEPITSELVQRVRAYKPTADWAALEDARKALK